MNVEQTTQLIQLILNSVLMVLASGLLLGGMLIRYGALDSRLQGMNAEYLELMAQQGVRSGDRLVQLKKHLRQLQHQSRTSRLALTTFHYALLVFTASTFVLTLRMVIEAAWLIPTSLTLFTIATAILLLGVTFALVDLHGRDRPLWEDMKWIFSLGQPGKSEARSGAQRPRLLPRTVGNLPAKSARPKAKAIPLG